MLPPIQDLTTFLIDLDGVIYRGETLIPGAEEFIAWLEANHKKYLFLTNNSFASEAQVVKKLGRLGITVHHNHVLGAAQATVKIIEHRYPGASVYVVGEQPLVDLVLAHDLKVANADWQSTDVVLVGLDRHFDYKKLNEAVLSIRRGAKFIAINRDPLLPIAGGDLIAGCGAMVGAIAAGSEINPEVIGKPKPGLLLEALAQLESKPEESIMIGDNIGIDIKAGIAASTHTMLVFSGKDTPESLIASSIKPDYVYADLADVMKELKARKL